MTLEQGMKLALDEARMALREGEVPIGAVVVTPQGRVAGRGHNRTEALADVTAHAEMQAITAAAQAVGGKYLDGCTLFVTVEPCAMCAAAAGWAQLSHVVYGCADPKRGYTAFCDRHPFHPRATVVSGVLEAECSELMKAFFAMRRKK